MEYDQTQILSMRGTDNSSIHLNFVDNGLAVSVVTKGGFQGDFYFDEITLKMFAYAYKIHCEKIRELNEKERIPKSCDCRNCMNAGEVKDFMVFCWILNVYRSVGIRPYCAKFKNK